ncbi:MAG: sugar transferase [Fimbriimonadales bacterium]
MLSYDGAKSVPQAATVVAPGHARDTMVDLAVKDTSERTPCEQYARPHYQAGKRLFDLVVSILALIVLCPLFLIISIAILATGGLPIVYRQTRVGRNGKHFKIFKFRTMVENAEEILKDRPELMEEYQRTYKITNDPRVSRLGHILRSWTLDELPQLFNVIQGDMSLVGPRPVVPPELQKFGPDQGIYLYMKPGCAGLWQCSGRSDLTYDERVRLDLMYCKKASLRYDFRILCRTFLAIILRRGAA